MRAFLDSKQARLRRNLMREIRRVLSQVAEPKSVGDQGAEPSDRVPSTPRLRPVRIVNDPMAPALQPQDVDRLFPWRQRELAAELNRRVGQGMLSTYDIQAVRRQHKLDERPDFVFHLPGAGRRYSPAVADWMLDEFAKDEAFFRRAHAADQAMLRARRQKPR
jgi:hypothetical protein